MALAVGETLSCYEILGSLGAGAMGEVYRARDTRLDREVAIKVLPEHLAQDEERLRRFEREAKSLASLNHPNVAQVFGIDQDGDTWFIAMELVAGETLEDRLARGAVPLEEAVDVCCQIADGLEAAHAAGVVHRDLKPANVCVTPEGRVKVLDFGLAKVTGAGESPASTADSVLATEEGRVLGTPTYMAPEQARGRPIDRRVDVWAFGCVLFECLAGRRAFEGETLAEILAAVVHEEPDWGRLPAATPGHVRTLLARCLQKDPQRRLRDVGDAGLMLAEPEDDPPAGAAGSPGWRRVAPLLLAAAVIAFGLGLLLRSDPAVEPPRVTQITFTGEDYQPSVSPDGRLIAFTSGRNGISQVWLRQVTGGGEQPLTEGPDWRPRFSHDGSTVTFIRGQEEGYAAYRVPVVGGQPRRLIEDVTEVELSPDGKRLVFVRGAAVGDVELGSRIGVLDLESGEERILRRMDGDLFCATWSPDGTRVCATKTSVQGGGGDWRTVLIDANTGETMELDLSGSRGLASGAAWAGSSALVLAVSATTVSGTPLPSSIIRYDLASREARTLFWASDLFPFRGSLAHTTQIGVIDEHSLVFDSYQQTQSLYEVGLGEETRPPRLLIAGISVDRQPSYHPDGSRVLFTSNRSGNVDLFCYDFASKELLQLTDHPSGDWDGAYTPDGESILFSSERSGSLEIWMADADGANPRQVTGDGDVSENENPTMSRDGQWIVYSSGHAGHPGIRRIHPDGTGDEELAPGNYVQPDVSPDGRFALFVATDNARLVNTITVLDLETLERTPFEVQIQHGLRSPNVTYGRGRWLPDGSAIVYVGIDEDGTTGLWAQDFRTDRNTMETRRRLTGFVGGLVHESFGIAPDGRTVTLSAIDQVRTINLVDRLPALR